MSSKISGIVIGGLLLWSAGALAADPPQTPAPLATAEDSVMDSDPCLTDVLCRSRFNRGRKLSKEDNFDEALTSYELAYQRKPVAWLLINIGRTLHKLGRPGEAIERYRQYLKEDPSGLPERKQRAEQFLKEAMEEDAAQRARKRVPAAPQLHVPENTPSEEPAPAPLLLPTPDPVQPPSVAVLPPGPPPSKSAGPGWLWGGIAAGGALLVAGAASGGLALSAAGSGRSAVYVGEPSQEALDAQARARALGIAADVLIGVGVATVGAVTVTYLVKRARNKRTERALHPSGSVSPGAAVLTIGGAF